LWAKLQPLLPAPKGRHGRNDRLFIGAICWMLRTGATWRDPPAEFGPWRTVCGRYTRWTRRSHWDKILELLKKMGFSDTHLIDSTTVKANKAAAGASGGQENHGIGRSRGGLTTKIYMTLDERGVPLAVAFTAGQTSDFARADELAETNPCTQLIADRSYDSDHFRNTLSAKGIMPIISGRGRRKNVFPPGP
jgi:transposase